jgi:hypothetical protein
MKVLSRKGTIRMIVGCVCAALLTVTAFGYVFAQHKTAAAPRRTAGTHRADVFGFNAQLAPAWSEGPSNATSLAVFNRTNDCFASLERRAETISVDTAAVAVQRSLTSAGYAVSPIQDVSTVLHTANGDLPYVLHQYTVTGANSDEAPEKAQEVGYIPLQRGYIFVQAYCSTTAELETTVVALTAITWTAPAELPTR